MMNLHEALLYLNFANTLERSGIDNSKIAELVSEAQTLIADTENIPQICSDASVMMFSNYGITVVFGGYYKLHFTGKDIDKLRELDKHLIGKAYIDEDDTLYITSRPRTSNAARIVTVLKDISFTISVVESEVF